MASRLLALLERGGDGMPRPLGPLAKVIACVMSDDEVGLQVAREYLESAPMHSAKGRHFEVLRASQSASVIAQIIFDGCKGQRGICAALS
mmetsp:Transcript_24050/g.70496  ORF Transcript_24050/g.70496 Transcript_24050/m.70496 type:complete len:90 (+) Transcript_24050:503-772(+)